MKLCTLGVNHETAPVDIRETVSFSADTSIAAIEQLKQHALVSECVILSTCNRTELYCILKDEANEPKIQEWLHGFFELENNQLSPYIYQHHDLEAVKHIMRVASGLPP